MEERKLDLEQIKKFEKYLIYEEKSAATVEKYLRDDRAFLFMERRNVTKELVIEYKESLEEHPMDLQS